VTLAALAVTPRAGAARLVLQAEAGGLDPAYLDKLLAPVALYPDQLLAQMLLCACQRAQGRRAQRVAEAERGS
jgi:hypothetical protein